LTKLDLDNLELKEGDIISLDGGIMQWVLKRDYFYQASWELLPFDEEAHLCRMTRRRKEDEIEIAKENEKLEELQS